jgi:glutaminase
MASLERHYISTGHLPAPEMVQSLVQDRHRPSKSNSDGKNSQAYPALARVPSELFGVCVVGTSGRIYGAGDVDYEFSIMSVSKPFLFALICETIGPEEARAKSARTPPDFHLTHLPRSPRIRCCRRKSRRRSISATSLASATTSCGA